ncbi:LuxR family two component transcriptional regulator [Arcticibacter tournemirensis]|uniref:Response regulator transcription factor n=1 Tax=Arcticibacter tournemirensis TaxID=699437 RepID=A0A5M9HI88_9SPHI|nr:response regulator transcription factor [Arcticibacter tournemirensis]KAA8486742.1 response regulator transcription factor [Arcticibacter tournemirensis]TQM49284.1 LuxR family two component transcriptional regulator [Arcticibacter tournemirensis]
MIKILLAEDHNIVRNGLRSLLENQSDIQVIDEVPNGKEALQKVINGLKPDVVLADVNMPELDGIGLTEKLHEIAPAIKVLILSMLEHENYVLKAMSFGAAGYLLKSSSQQELIFAIHHVMAGNLYICSEISLKLLARIPQHPQNTEEDIRAAGSLSKREKEILALIAEGYTNSEIADMLFTSRRTVEGHRQNLIEKTRARNTAALIRFAIKNGIIS